MVMPRVNVILSTYNGEKYIEEQLASLLAQDYPNIDIYIRDDGSTDSTIMILEKYVRQGKIHLLQGENLGFCGSFIGLFAIRMIFGKKIRFNVQSFAWKNKMLNVPYCTIV